MPNPKISIIIPAYQHGRELPKCLDSILTQTLRDFEVIVANDGSIDNTAMVLEKYKLDFSYANLKLTVVNQINQGANSARNNGARKATGEYMLFCDADVVMVPMMLEKMLKALIDNPDKSYVYSSFYFGWKKFKLWPFNSDKLKETNYIHTTSLIKKSDFPGFDEKIKRLQDWDLWLTMLEQGKTGIWISEFLFCVLSRRTGMSQWLPSFFYNGLPFLPQVKKYQTAEKIIREKHHI